MKLLSNVSLRNGSVVVTIALHELTPAELLKISQYGAISLDIGGAFNGADSADETLSELSFTLPSKIVAVPSGLPLVQVFALADNSDADQRAKLWKELTLGRIDDAHAELMARNTAASGDEIHTFPLT